MDDSTSLLTQAPLAGLAELAGGGEFMRQYAPALLAHAQVGLLLLDGQLVRFANPAASAMFGLPIEELNGAPWTRVIAPLDQARVAQQVQQRLAGVPGRPYDIVCRHANGSLLDVRVCGQAVSLAGQVMNLVTLLDVSELKAAWRRAEWNAGLLARSEALCRSGSFELAWPSGRVAVSSGLLALVGAAPGNLDGESVDQLSWVPESERNLVAAIWRNAVPNEAFEFQHRLCTLDGRTLVVLHRGVLSTNEGSRAPSRGIAFLQDITQQREAERRVQELANFDEVTGLPNRASLLDRLDALVHAHAAHWEERAFSLIFVEVPRIDEVSSSMGLGAGDALAMALAVRLSQLAQEPEMVAHVGGSEFAVLIQAAGPSFDADIVCNRALAIQSALQVPVQLGEADVFVQCKIGIAGFPHDGSTAQALFEAARTACLGADGSGGLAFAHPEASARAVRELQLAGALRQAIERGELRVLYQPQVSLESGAIVGAEALLRWHSPEWGHVSPVEFIPIAERSGLIDLLGDWVLHRTCEQSVAWRKQGLPPIRLSVNVSPLQFRRGDVARQVQLAILETGVDPAYLGIELTESTLMEQTERAAGMLTELKNLGVEISLDDFGTGFSSLSCLRSLPIDVVKVDRSFVNDVTAAPESASVTRSIITMAHALQMRVLAEGVETESQLSLLLDKGCDLIQGYLFSRPVTAETVEQMLREGRCLPEHLTTRRQRRRTLLLVDDEPNILTALKRLLRRDGYQIITATHAEEGLQRLAQQPVDVIISDQRMPGMTGVEFLNRAKVLYPDTIRMTLSGFTDLQSIIDAVNEGAVYKFLTKPWDDERLRAHVDEAFRRKELADDNRQLGAQLANANAELAEVNQRLEVALARQREQALLLQASAGGVRDLLDELPAVVIGLDPDGLLAYVNRQACSSLDEADTRLGLPASPWLVELAAQLEQPGRAGLPVLRGHCWQAWARSIQSFSGSERGRLLMLLPSAEEPVGHEAAK